MQPAERICCRQGGFEELKCHPFFRPIDWDALYAKEITPPFVPLTAQSSDTSNVDPDFLAEAPEETPMMDNALLQMAH